MQKQTDTSLSVNTLRARRGTAAAIVFAVFINLFLYHAFGTTAITLVLLALYTVVFTVWGTGVQSKPILALGAIGTLCAATVTVRGSSFVQFLSTVGSLMTGVLLLVVNASGGKFFRSFSEIVFAPVSLIAPYINGLIIGIKTLIGSGGRTKSSVIGLVVGVPIALVLVQHLIRADVIFAYWVRNAVSQDLLARIMTHTFVTIAAFLFVLPFGFLYVVRHVNMRQFISQFSFTREATVILGLVAVVLGGFLVVQTPYIFVRVAAETDLSRFGVATYSEYVKQGFGEFIFISLIFYVLGWFGVLGNGKYKGDWGNRGNQRALSMVQWVLFAEIVVYIASIFCRIILYVQFHGFTLGRLYGGLFLVWVTFLFITLAARCVWPKVRWVLIESIGTAIIFFIFAFGNAEHFVATIRPPTVNNNIDYVYLSRMSPDGYAGWLNAYEYSRQILTSPAFAQKKILDEGDRREIAYAGMILSQLAAHGDWYASIYEGVPLPNGRRFNQVDRLYLWNVSAYQAYTRMRTEMPKEALQSLMRTYESLIERIAHQPPDEQGYGRDVSFDGPFLSPL